MHSTQVCLVSPYLWSCSVRWCLARGLAIGDQRRRTGSGTALEALRDNTLYKDTFTLLWCLTGRAAST